MCSAWRALTSIASNLTVGEFIPDEKPLRAVIPPAPPLMAMLQGYTGDKEVAAGERFDATPANIEAHTKRGTIGALKTAFLERKSRGGRVSGVHRSALRRSAVAAEPRGRRQAHRRDAHARNARSTRASSCRMS